MNKTCKDCIHNDVCFLPDVLPEQENEKKYTSCSNHKPKSRYIELPCAVGDTVYMRFEGKITPFLITHVFAEQKINEDVIKCYAAKGKKVSTGFSANHIGKTVFLTKEEAEQKLKGGAE